MGPTINLSKYIAPNAVSWNVLASANNGNAGLVTSTDFDAVPAVTENFANRIGYLYANPSSTATAKANVGHVFGRLGEGTDTLPANVSPIYFGATTSKKPAMILGVYPLTAAETGITDATKQTKFTVAGKAWGALDLNLPPSQPAGTSGPAKQKGGDTGAKFIAVGAATALALASTLY